MTKLSVAIPIYNFAPFIGETLDSILSQEGVERVDLVVVDGASTDATPEIMAHYIERHPALRYVRLPNKGGIDFDMHRTVEAAMGEYVWLFSGDDWMRPGALKRALAEIESGFDLYLCQHRERAVGLARDWMDWPVLEPSVTQNFNLADPEQRRSYFGAARTSEAFFSFMGGLVVKKSFWMRRPYNQEFDRSCWAHAARFFDLMRTKMDLRFIAETWLDRRPDNDSFMGRGFIARIAISIDGYHNIADAYFGHDSFEAFCVREVVRREFGAGMFFMGKFVCELDPEIESRTELWRLFNKAYSDFSLKNLKLRFDVWTMTSKRFRKLQPELTRLQEERIAQRKAFAKG